MGQGCYSGRIPGRKIEKVGGEGGGYELISNRMYGGEAVGILGTEERGKRKEERQRVLETRF